jgi:hypothetical protein
LPFSQWQKPLKIDELLRDSDIIAREKRPAQKSLQIRSVTGIENIDR